MHDLAFEPQSKTGAAKGIAAARPCAKPTRATAWKGNSEAPPATRFSKHSSVATATSTTFFPASKPSTPPLTYAQLHARRDQS